MNLEPRGLEMIRQYFLILALSITPVVLQAQYTGGDGNGDVKAAMNTKLLSGNTGSTGWYFGGNGDGDFKASIGSKMLNGTSVSLVWFFGGSGDGDVKSSKSSILMNGISDVTAWFFGGSGDGDIKSSSNSSYLGEIEWVGTFSTVWTVTGNWRQNTLPTNGRIKISSVAVNDLHLDQSRFLQTIQFQGAGKKVVLGNHNLTISESLLGIDLNNYIRTNGTGQLVRNLNPSEEVLFPVGKASYNPVTLTNRTGSPDTFSVRVYDVVYANGASGALTQAPHVKLTWDISKKSGSAAAGLGVDFKFQWHASQESPGMVDYVLNHHNGSVWEIPANMGTSTLIGTTDKFFSVPEYKGSFSPFAIGDNPISSLPISLSAFTAQCVNGQVQLKWTTQSEINNALFQVERSTDLLHWSLWSTLPGAGNSTTPLSYVLTDTERPFGTVYYRLSQMDFDGSTTYFAPVAVSCEGTQTKQLRAYPNPTSEVLYLECSGVTEESQGQIRLLDMQGRLWLTKDFHWFEGSQTFPIEVSDLPSGMYQVHVSQNGKLWPVIRVLVVKN